MKLSNRAAVAIDILVCFAGGRVTALNLDRAENNGTSNRLRGNKIKTVITLGKINVPSCISEKPGHIKFGK